MREGYGEDREGCSIPRDAYSLDSNQDAVLLCTPVHHRSVNITEEVRTQTKIALRMREELRRVRAVMNTVVFAILGLSLILSYDWQNGRFYPSLLTNIGLGIFLSVVTYTVVLYSMSIRYPLRGARRPK